MVNLLGYQIAFLQNCGDCCGGRLMQFSFFLILLIQFILAVLVGKSDALTQILGTQT